MDSLRGKKKYMKSDNAFLWNHFSEKSCSLISVIVCCSDLSCCQLCWGIWEAQLSDCKHGKGSWGRFFTEKNFAGKTVCFSSPLVFIVCILFCLSLEPAGCFNARGPGAPLRGGGAFVQVVRGRKWLCTAEGGRKRLVLGWPQLKLPVFPLRASKELSH